MNYFDDDKGFLSSEEADKDYVLNIDSNKMNSTLEGLGVSSQYFPQMKLSKWYDNEADFVSRTNKGRRI